MRAILLDARAAIHAARAGRRPTPRLSTLITLLCIAGFCYGLVMGSFGGFVGDRLLQVLYSALKMPLLLVVTFGLTLPSFFVLNTLLGLRRDFAEAVRALVGAQAVLAIVLASLAPYTAVWYLSDPVYHHATLFNAAMFAVASFAAQLPLRRAYRTLIQRDRRHRLMLRMWVVLYAFVGIQMGWVLRPFIGNPELPVRFFREDTWGNAYLIVWELIWKTLGGR
jgi:hypothetical protein